MKRREEEREQERGNRAKISTENKGMGVSGAGDWDEGTVTRQKETC